MELPGQAKPFLIDRLSGDGLEEEDVGEGEADRLEQQAAAHGREVQRDIERADDYMVAVVLFAITLFFAALSTKLKSRDMRIALLGLGYVLFLGTTVWLATQPVSVSI